MATFSQILGQDSFNNIIYEANKSGKSKVEIKALLQAKSKESLQLQKENQLKQNNQPKQEKQNTVHNAIKDSVYSQDSIAGDIARGVTTTGLRYTMPLIRTADWVSEKIGFDLVDDNAKNGIYTRSNETLDVFEAIKSKTSQQNLSPERLAEIKQLGKESNDAKGLWENIVAGVNSGIDLVMHPTEVTWQGSAEMITDPTNALALGFGTVASKFGKTFISKVGIGAGAGALEGGLVNAPLEYGVAIGQGKSHDEATKIAQMSLGGGIAMGTGLGSMGGAIGHYAPKLKNEDGTDKSVDDILENDLLKTNEVLTPDEIGEKLKGHYPNVEGKYKTEIAGEQTKPTPPNFTLVYDNLPAVITPKDIETIDARIKRKVEDQFKIENAGQGEFTQVPHPESNINFKIVNETLPLTLRELVDTQVIGEDVAKQIEYKNKVILLGYEDVISTDIVKYKDELSTTIVNEINKKQIQDIATVEQISLKADESSKALTVQLIEQGADARTIKQEINKQIVPTPQEQKVAMVLNDGMPLENRFSGLRLRQLAQNTIDSQIPQEPKVLTQKLANAGVSEPLNKAVVQSVINGDINVLDDFVSEKLTNGVEKQQKQMKEDIKTSLSADEFFKQMGQEIEQENLVKTEKLLDSSFDEMKKHPKFDMLIDMRRNVSAKSIENGRKLTQKRTVVHDKDKFNGEDKTKVVGATYEKNYESDFTLTKRDIANIEKGKVDDKVLQKIKDDLNTLDNHPEWENEKPTKPKKETKLSKKLPKTKLKEEPKKDTTPKPIQTKKPLMELTPQEKINNREFRKVKEEIQNRMDQGYRLKDSPYNQHTRKDGNTKIINETTLEKDGKTTKIGDNLVLTKEQLDIAIEYQKELANKDKHKNRWQEHKVLKDLDKDISYEEGMNAHRGTSFSPEQRGRSEVSSWIEGMTTEYEHLKSKYATTPEKLETLDSEFARYRAGLLKHKKQVLSSRSRIVSSMISGAGNFPVARMNKLNGYVDNAMDKMFKYDEKALNSIKRKLTDSGIIKSDDIDAISKLEAKISKLETNQQLMKDANKILRSKKTTPEQKVKQMIDAGWSEKNGKKVVDENEKFPSYRLTNNNATIKTAKDRLKQLQNEKELADAGGVDDVIYNNGSIHENTDIKRVQLFFDEKPNETIRTDLKKNGFRWSPKEGAWQRLLNNQGRWKAKDIMDLHFKKKQSEDVGTKFEKAMKNEEDC